MQILPEIERGPTWTESHRHHCEVLAMLRRTREERQKRYRLIAKHRGRAAAERLIANVKSEWERTR